MPTEIQENPSKIDDRRPKPKDGKEGDATESLRPSRGAYEDFSKGAQAKSPNGGLEPPPINPIDGSLTIKPLFGREDESTKPDGSKDENASSNGKTIDGKTDKRTDSKTGDQIGGQNDNQTGDQVDSKTDSQTGDQADSKTGDQVDSRTDKPDQADQPSKEIKDGEDIPLNAEAQQAKDEFTKILEDRFKDDPRAKDDPNLVKTLESRMSQMDKRILNERVQQADGSLVNQQEQLTNTYKNLSRIGTDAEKLTYTENGSQHKVFNKSDVNNILAGGIVRGADPEHFYNQGKNNTCAAESINRQGNELVAGDDSKTIADMCTKGQFQAVDKQGKQFTCKVDKKSLSPDRQAQNIYLNQTNARDAYGQAGDIRTAQLNLDLMSREKAGQRGQSGGEGNLVYSKGPTFAGQRDTGEKVTDTRTGRVVADNPCLDAKGVSSTKQSLYGGRLGRSFGKDTTLVSNRAFDSANATATSNGAQLKSHLKALEAKGWGMSTVATHVGNYVDEAAGLSGAEGWHATSLKFNEKGKLNADGKVNEKDSIDFVNNWGTDKNVKDINADKLFSWMNAPANSSAADQRRGDHIFNPGGSGQDGNPARDALAKKDEHKPPLDKKEEDVIAQLRKAQQREEEYNRQQMQNSRTKLSEIEAQLAGLSPDDAQRTNLLAQKQLYEHNIKFI